MTENDPVPFENSPECDPADVGLKSMFMGPQAENSEWVLVLLSQFFRRWVSWRRRCYPNDGRAISTSNQKSPEFLQRREQFAQNLSLLAKRFEEELPTFSPRYIGHMVSEISLPALFGHIVALMHNPNNISGEVSRAGLEIEREAVVALLQMIGFDATTGRGHFTSGGTVANFEAMLRARGRMALWLAGGACSRELGWSTMSLFDAAHTGWDSFGSVDKRLVSQPNLSLSSYNFVHANPWQTSARLSRVFQNEFSGPVVLVPQNKHYSWVKGVSILGIGHEAFWPVELDQHGRLSLNSLRAQITRAAREQRPVMMVVSVAGTTEMGQLDPIHGVQEYLDSLCSQHGWHIWHHVDAAYGGFFCSLDRGPGSVLGGDQIRDLGSIARSNSVTLDPHKLGYVPYASGTILVREARDYFVNATEAPYIQYQAKDPGPYTLEGSRSAAGAVATWMTAKTMGLDGSGYGRVIERTIRIRAALEQRLRSSGLPLYVAPDAATNIVCFSLARDGEPLSQSNQRTESLYRNLTQNPAAPFFVSKTTLHWRAYGDYLDRFCGEWRAEKDVDHLTLIRLCMMNPFFDSREMDVKFSDALLETLKDFLDKG